MTNEWGFVEGKDGEVYQYEVDKDGEMHFYKPTVKSDILQFVLQVAFILVFLGLLVVLIWIMNHAHEF